jgi:hypothetical protein
VLIPAGLQFLVSCDSCRFTSTLHATSIDTARVNLELLGWNERRQKRKSRARWHWVCPGCAATLSRRLGPST